MCLNRWLRIKRCEVGQGMEDYRLSCFKAL
ncbi:hypothetical protein [Gloeothece citriformis]